MEAKELTKLAVKALEDKKGEDIRVIDIHGVSVLCHRRRKQRQPGKGNGR